MTQVRGQVDLALEPPALARGRKRSLMQELDRHRAARGFLRRPVHGALGALAEEAPDEEATPEDEDAPPRG